MGEPSEEATARTAPETHRGAFGEFGGESGAFIERTFRERIAIVGVTIPPAGMEETEISLDELERLVDTAGADVVARLHQRRSAPDAATFIGRGKVDELKAEAELHDVDTVVFDDELSPAQQANLTKILGRTAIDRTAVILDIFAQNAASLEGKAQVELALLRYRLPRLRGGGVTMSQQAGGIGTRGPGETQLEVDRRRIQRRINTLQAQLRSVEGHRATQAKQRQRSANDAVAIVGYTNAGKSSLLNRLTGAGVVAQDRLFATLDATTRRLALPGGETVFVTDTVGFIRKLPHQLVEAFRSTLDVVIDADLLVHVVDSSSADPEAEMRAVHEVLAEIGAGDVHELVVFNKSDRVAHVDRLVATHPGSVAVSAATGDGIEQLLATIGDRLRAATELVEVLVPFGAGDVMAEVHRSGHVLGERPVEGGMLYEVRLDAASAGRLAEWIVDRADVE
ncbi:MAG: GTPase HflX [Acidimicrobiales bacterium]